MRQLQNNYKRVSQPRNTKTHIHTSKFPILHCYIVTHTQTHTERVYKWLCCQRKSLLESRKLFEKLLLITLFSPGFLKESLYFNSYIQQYKYISQCGIWIQALNRHSVVLSSLLSRWLYSRSLLSTFTHVYLPFSMCISRKEHKLWLYGEGCIIFSNH